MAGFSKLRFRAFTALSYCALWLSCVTLMNPNRSQPDVLVQAFVFLDLVLVHRLMTHRTGVAVLDSVVLGLCLGLGFYLKSAMLPTGAFLILIVSFLLWRRSRSLAPMLVASVIFAVAVAPYVLALSRQMGRLTIGDSGRLNYAWSVNGVPLWVGWTGSPGDGMPIHGPRVVSAEPKVLEFAAPVPGTYPLWYNPSYWHEGIKTPYHLLRQARTIKASLVFLGGLLLELSPFCLGFVLLWFLRSRKSSVNRTRATILFGLVLCTMGMYGLVIYEKRYVAPFVVILIVELSRMLAVRTSVFRFAAVCTAVVFVTFLPLGFRSVRHLAGSSDMQPGRMDYAIAESVRRNGLQPGDKIAFVGPAMLHQGWAQVANLRITVQFFDEAAFWNLGEQERANCLNQLRRAGPRAIIAVAPRSVSVACAWVALPSLPNGDRIYLLTL
jgi:hypothetical protein